MAKLSPVNWMLWRAKSGIQPSSQDILVLLDSRDAAVKGLNDILAECPKKPIKPFCKRIKELAETAINEAKD